ncbi:MAG: sigma-54-dependent Fis family transcriptional regulator [Candidatus Brocadiaceae bacterium]|nr:sigma-54-dependent Fis family transcriptional regulator [Candidatus Brocadiaceae bacterium]
MPERILVVDDEENIRFTFENFLSDEGYAVKTAENFEEAWSLLCTSEYDVIFADIILGGKTGLDLLKSVKGKKFTCPFIMITGSPDIETATEALRLGAFDYIQKPVLQDTLLRTTKIALKQKSLIDEKDKYLSNIEAIFRSVKDAIISVDTRSCIINANHAAKYLCGIDSKSIGEKFLPTQCNHKCLNALSETIKKKQPVEYYRVECNNKTHPHQVVTISAQPLFNQNHKLHGAVLVIKDETHIAKLEQNMRERTQFHSIVGQNQKMQAIYSLIENLADVQTTVLILGESGTGKELIAHELHHSGKFHNRPYVKANCSAFPESLQESELFGHVKGAFTGAAHDKAGRFKLADGGTIFLDEIGEISQSTQLLLLRVLQEREFEPVGSSTPVKVDVRVITATNQNLYKKVMEGSFRQDLYYRLKVVEITVPPLRERRDDIPLLINHFLVKYNNKLNKTIEAISDDVKSIFMEYLWPGNIRELEHTIEYSFILCQHNIITIEDLPRAFVESLIKKNKIHHIINTMNESSEIIEVLKNCAWNKARAARLLGMSRRTLYRKLKEHNIGHAPPQIPL